MKLPQIRLESKSALIGIETQNAKVNMQQPKADLDLQQPKAELTIVRTPSKLTIDQTAAREAVDLKSVAKRVEEFALNGKKDLLSGIGRRAQEGMELMKIESKGNPLVEQAKRNSERPEKQFNIGFIPPPFSVKINYEPTKLDIDWKIQKVINNTKTNKPIIEYEPGKVNISMQQKNSLRIDFVNVDFNA